MFIALRWVCLSYALRFVRGKCVGVEWNGEWLINVVSKARPIFFGKVLLFWDLQGPGAYLG